MISLTCICLCCLSMVDTSFSTGRKYFELDMGQPFGIHGCRKQCDDRNGCVAVKYFRIKLSCFLKLNTSNIREEKGYETEVQRLVRTRSGRSVTISEVYTNLPKNPDQSKHDGERMSFKPPFNAFCKVSGKQNTILEPTEGASWRSPCKTRLGQTFLRIAKYSWTLSVRQTDNVVSNTLFTFRSTFKGRVLSSFSLFKEDGFFRIGKTDIKRLYCKSIAMLKITLRKGTVDVMDLNTNVTMLTVPLARKHGSRFSIFLRIFLKGSSDFKMTLNDRNTGLCE